jgi:subtilisin family serine protease
MKHSAFLLDRGRVPRIRGTVGHVFLQLARPLDSPMRSVLLQRGVIFLEYVPKNTWKVRLPAAALPLVRQLPFVHAMGDIHPVDKFPVRLLERDFRPSSYGDDGTLAVLATFHADIPFDRVLTILSQLSGTTHQPDFISGHRVLLSIPGERLQDLAELDEVSWIEDRPGPKQAHNIKAADLSNIDELFASPYQLDGSGIAVGEWDAGEVQSDHPDLAGRVYLEEASSIDPHSTHVAGTIVGDGSGNPDAKGMAPAATLHSYDWDDDYLAEMADAEATYGIRISNNSWAYVTGWQFDFYEDGLDVWFGDEDFGDYTSESAAWDQTAVDTGLVLVKSAGNDRDDDGDQAQTGHHHEDDPSTVYFCPHPPDGDYDCVGQIGSAKNLLTIGAVRDTGNMTLFSSWGPTDDGRIKPDIVANGASVTSTCPTSDYCVKSGTSMAGPVVAGAAALLLQRYQEELGVAPSAAAVKAMLINTATDWGNAGPDYSYGWGLLDAKAAVDLVDEDRDHVKQDSISNAETLEYPVRVSHTAEQLRITVAWTDPAASPVAAYALVNDIDLELVDPFDGVHLPWILDPNAPTAEASTGVNSVDNVEQVLVDSPYEGLWTIRITGTSVQGSQSFAMTSNLQLNAAPIPAISGWAGVTVFLLSISAVLFAAVRAD